MYYYVFVPYHYKLYIYVKYTLSLNRYRFRRCNCVKNYTFFEKFEAYKDDFFFAKLIELHDLKEGISFWSFSFHSRIFHSFGDVIITGEWLQHFTLALHLWLLRVEGSLECHTYAALLRPPMKIKRLFFHFKTSYNKTDASVFNLTDI